MKALNLLLATLVLPVTLAAQGQVVSNGGIVVQGNGPNWTPDLQGNGYAAVTTARPCGLAGVGPCSGGYGNVGNGSLQLGVTGVGNSSAGYPDYAFYSLFAAPDQSFGNLSALSSLSFDWFRTSVANWDSAEPIDWRYKTPVMRLRIAETRNDQKIISELVWEGYYNQQALGGYTPVDQWVSQNNMQNDNFWYIGNIGGVAGYSASGNCATQMSLWQGGVNASNTSGLFGPQGCLYEANVEVIGIGVGVGSQWPLPWAGAVDNVRMSFNDQQVVNANFDVSNVPEPATGLLIGAGLVALGVAYRRRHGRSTGA